VRYDAKPCSGIPKDMGRLGWLSVRLMACLPYPSHSAEQRKPGAGAGLFMGWLWVRRG